MSQGAQLTVYGGFGSGHMLNQGYGAASGQIGRIEKQLANARGDCIHWSTEYEERLARDAKKGPLKFLSPLAHASRLLQPADAARKKRDKACARAASLETSLVSMRGDIAAANPVFSIPDVAASSLQANPTPMSPMLGFGVFGGILVLGLGLLAVIYSRRK